MENKKTYKDYYISNETLREQFMVKYLSKQDGKDVILFHDTPWGINFGIEMDSTNGLGYKPIRKKRQNIDTPDKLKQHLAEMDFRVLENKDEIHKSGIFGSLLYINNLESEKRYLTSSIKKSVEIIHEFVNTLGMHNQKMDEVYGKQNLTHFEERPNNLIIKFPKIKKVLLKEFLDNINSFLKPHDA